MGVLKVLITKLRCLNATPSALGILKDLEIEFFIVAVS